MVHGMAQYPIYLHSGHSGDMIERRKTCILRPMRGGHAKGVEVRLSARAEGTLRPEVKRHETEEVGSGREVGYDVMMEGLKEKKSVSDICREHKVSQTLYYKWRDKFLGGSKALDHGAWGEETHRAEVEKFEKIIGKQAIQIEIQKKRRSYSGKSRGGQSPAGLRLYGEGCLPGRGDLPESILQAAQCEESGDYPGSERSASFGADPGGQDGASFLGVPVGEGGGWYPGPRSGSTRSGFVG